MAFNLKAMTTKELSKLKMDVEKALVSAEERARRDALKAVEKAAAEFGFSFDELSGKAKPKAAKKGPKKKSKAKAKAPPKYRNPADPEQTWSGRGRQPFWFKDAVTSGTDPSVLEI
jgi:DNA-binding protein H-NS